MIRLKTAEAKRDRLALYAILLLSLLLNSYGLDWGLTGLPRPYASVHPDEDFCFAPGFSFLRGQVTADVFFWGGTFFQMAMAATLGVARLCGSSPTTEWVHGLFVMTRLGVAINGVFNVFLVSLLGQRLGRRWVPDASEEVGLWGAAFFAVMPAPVALAHHIRPDVMLVTGILLVALMAERLMGPPPGVWPRQPDAENLIRQGTTVVSGIGHASAAVTSQPGARSSHTWWPCLLAGGSLGFTTAVRLNGAFCAPGLAVALMLNPQEKAKTRRLILMLAVALAVFAALSPFSLIYGPDLIGFYPAMKRAPFLDAYHRGPVLWQYATRVMWHGVGPALLVASYVGLALACWRRSQADVFVAAFVAPLAVSTGMSNLIYVRYLLPVLPFLAILAACAFVGAGTRARLRQAARAGVFGLSLLLCVAADSLFSQNDTRLAAARWIDAHVKPGARIAVLRLSVFYFYPWPDKSKYLVMYHRGHAEKERPPAEQMDVDYWILSEHDYRHVVRLGDAHPSPVSARFVQRLMKGEPLEGRVFRLAQEFQNPPKILGFPIPRGSPPEDLLYTNPTIRIYKRER